MSYTAMAKSALYEILKFMPEKLREKRGWRLFAAAFSFGAAAALAFPPFNVAPLIFVCFPALVFMLQGAKNWKQAFLAGWSFAFGLLVVSLYWIAGSLFVDIKTYWWAVPLSVAGLPAAFSVYYGIAAVAAVKWGVRRLDGIIFASLCWFVADFARGEMFTGFPWDITGYVWGDILSVMQSVSVIGIYGLTLITIVAAFLPAALLSKEEIRKTAACSFAVAASFVLFFVWGELRLQGASDETAPDVRIRLVQSDVGQAMKWKKEERENNFRKMLDLTFAPSEKPVTHYFWPETAVAYYLTEEPEKRKEIAEKMPENAVLLTGIVRRDFSEDGRTKFYNSIIAIDGKARVIAGYDKAHLVPFGEYMPFRSYVPIPAVAGMDSDFSFGDGNREMRVPNLPPFIPLVCYEVIFSGQNTDMGSAPEFIFNATNDAWYENTTGPYQHFAIARARAIEEGLPLIRVANKGYTAIIDSYGRVKAISGESETGYIEGDLPKKISVPTVFSEYKHTMLWLLLYALLAISVLFRINVLNSSGKKSSD